MHPVDVTGDRIDLRELSRRDVRAVHRWTSDPEAVRLIPLGPTSMSETRSYVRQIEREANEDHRRVYTLGVVEHDNGELIGSVGLTVDSMLHRRAELGYVIRRDRWGMGYGTEAAALGLRLGFEILGLHRIWAVCDTDNAASMHILDKLGMRHEGVLRGDLRIGDEWRDAHMYALVDHEWRRAGDDVDGQHGARDYGRAT